MTGLEFAQKIKLRIFGFYIRQTGGIYTPKWKFVLNTGEESQISAPDLFLLGQDGEKVDNLLDTIRIIRLYQFQENPWRNVGLALKLIGIELLDVNSQSLLR